MAFTRGHKRLCHQACLIGGMLLLADPVHAKEQDQPSPKPEGASASDAAGRREGVRPSVARPPLQSEKGAASPEQKLERAKLAYQRGDYGQVVLLLRPLLYPQTLLAQEEQVLLAHKLLALSFYFEHDEAGAEQEFNLLLSLRPDFALDPVVDPLQAVAFLDDIRRRNAERLQEIRRRQAEEEQQRRIEAEQLQRQADALAQQRSRRVYIERTIHKRFSLIDLLPFGVPQLVEHRRKLGTALLVGEALTGATSLATWLAVRYRYPTGQYPPRELLLTQSLTGTYLATGVVFWGLVLAGLVDALVHARTLTEVRELPGPPPDLPQYNPPPRDKPPLHTSLGISADGSGLALHVRGDF